MTAKNKKHVPAPPLVCVEPNPGPRRSQRLSEEERWRVIHLSTEMHLSHRNIAKRMGIRQQTVIDLLKKYHEIGAVKDRPGRGRKRVVTEEDEKEFVKRAKKDKDATQIAQEYREKTGISISERSVQRILHKHNLRYLVHQKVEAISDANKAKRLQYAIEMRGHNWKNVFFSDEKSFFLGSEKTHSWEAPGKRKTHFVQRHPKKIHVWAAAGSYMRSKLYFFKDNLDSPLYQKIISNRLQEKNIIFSPDCPEEFVEIYEFLQDNDPKHKARKTMALLGELVEDRIISHPPQSPDLNIMEDLWSYLDLKIRAARIKTISGLKRKLTMEWEKLPWAVIRTAVKTMPARLAECEQLHGGRTHY